MPARPLRYCLEPSCPELVEAGRCPTHSRAHDRARGTATERHYTARWAAYSLRFRRRHPLCWYCLAQGRTTASECVDHIEAHRGDRTRFWDRTNHAAACLACNTGKANTWERGRGHIDYRALARRGRELEVEVLATI